MCIYTFIYIYITYVHVYVLIIMFGAAELLPILDVQEREAAEKGVAVVVVVVAAVLSVEVVVE